MSLVLVFSGIWLVSTDKKTAEMNANLTLRRTQWTVNVMPMPRDKILDNWDYVDLHRPNWCKILSGCWGNHAQSPNNYRQTLIVSGSEAKLCLWNNRVFSRVNYFRVIGWNNLERYFVFSVCSIKPAMSIYKSSYLCQFAHKPIFINL